MSREEAEKAACVRWGGEEGVRSVMGSPGAGPMGFALHSQSNRQPVKGVHVTGADAGALAATQEQDCGSHAQCSMPQACSALAPPLMSVPPGSWARLVPLLHNALSPLGRQVAVGVSQEATSSRGLLMLPLPFSVSAPQSCSSLCYYNWQSFY